MLLNCFDVVVYVYPLHPRRDVASCTLDVRNIRDTNRRYPCFGFLMAGLSFRQGLSLVVLTVGVIFACDPHVSTTPIPILLTYYHVSVPGLPNPDPHWVSIVHVRNLIRSRLKPYADAENKLLCAISLPNITPQYSNSAPASMHIPSPPDSPQSCYPRSSSCTPT